MLPRWPQRTLWKLAVSCPHELLDAIGARKQAPYANSSSSALASFRSSVLKPFNKPAIDRSEQIAGLLRLALVAPEARHARGGAEFQRFCALFAGRSHSLLEASLCCLRMILVLQEQ